MKKINYTLASILAICFILIAISPSNIYAAKKPRLNKASITITSEDSIQLKVLNSTANWKWKSSNNKIADVNSFGYINAVNPGTCKITATSGNKKLTCKVTVKQSDSEAIFEISQWLCEKIWNKGLCDLRDYYSTGSDSCGHKMDVNKTITNFNKEYKKLSKYNKTITNLKGNKYKSLKIKWKRTIKELQSLHTQVNQIDWSKCPTDDNAFNTDTFDKYFNDLYDLMCSL